MKITSEKLVPLFEDFAGSSFIGIRTMTHPKFIKKGRSTGKTIEEKFNCSPSDIVKFSSFSAGIGYDYKKSIENKLIKEGKSIEEYQAGESWHEKYNDSKVIRRHKKTGELYFYCSLNTKNSSPESSYHDHKNGKDIDKDDLSEFLPIESKPMNQGVDEGNEVQVRTLKLNSVISLSACGEEYIILDRLNLENRINRV